MHPCILHPILQLRFVQNAVKMQGRQNMSTLYLDKYFQITKATDISCKCCIENAVTCKVDFISQHYCVAHQTYISKFYSFDESLCPIKASKREFVYIADA